ncbi:MAG: YciI family protein [Candidatus Eiseniibacteriota bacterium]
MIRRRLAAVTLAVVLSPPLAADETPPMPAMSSYRFGLLRRGPSWTAQRTPATDSIQAGHMANIGRMAAQGVLLVSGPIGDKGDLRGVFIFRADSVARIRELAAGDPAIRSGRLVLDLYAWSAPAGIGEPYRRMALEPGHRDSMVRLQLVLLKTGPRFTREVTAETKSLQAAHVGGIFRALASGELATAGPFTDGGDLRAVLVYRGDSAYAHRRALEDPAVEAGHLTVEMHPWYTAYGTMPGDTLRVPRQRR